MKLKTSFFKPVTLKKDILRFAPIWAIYLVAMYLVLFEMGYYSDYDRYARNMLPDLVKAFGIVNLGYATLIAASLFGDLYNTKLCYSLHAMPYRRESWLMTHLLSGFLFSALPNLLACALMMVRLEAYWFLALYWLLANTLQFIFFYGVAAVSAMLTGNRFAMLLVTAVINFVSLLIYATVDMIYVPMLVGVVCNMEPYTLFSPVVQIFQPDYFLFTRVDTQTQTPQGVVTDTFYRYDGLAAGWGYLAILGVVGVAAMALAFWLYRKRHLESAGDFIAFPRLKGLACVIMTLCCTLGVGLVGEVFDSFILWLAVGLCIGFFGSLMLLERRVKVFRKKTFLGFGIMAIAVAVSLVAVEFDWFGIESWTPEVNQVKSITVANSRNAYYGDISTLVEDPADIQRIIDAHKDIYSRMGDTSNKRHQVRLEYKLKSGRTVIRYYYAPAVGEGYAIVQSYLYNTENILGFTDPVKVAARVQYMYSSFGDVPQALYEKILVALRNECNRGKVSLYDKGEYYLEYHIADDRGDTLYRSLMIDGSATELTQLLTGPECVMGYSDWAEFVKSVQKFTLSDKELSHKLSQDVKEDLLMAIRKDIEAGCDLGGRWVDGYDYVVSYYVPYPSGRTEYRELYITAKAQYTMAWLAANGYIPSETPHT